MQCILCPDCQGFRLGAALLVPYVDTEAGDFFLKTIIPSRKATKKYLRKGGEK